MTKVRNLAAEMEQVAAEGDLTSSAGSTAAAPTIFARCANTYLLELLEQTNRRLDPHPRHDVHLPAGTVQGRHR